MDHSHQNRVKDLRCRIKPKKIVVVCDVVSRSEEESVTAQHRSDLMADVFQRPVVIDWKLEGS
jgi:hypothetical protein